MIDERARHQLYLSLERHLGEAEADTMMDLLPPVGWADVASKRDIDMVNDRIDGLEANMNLRFDAMDHRFGSIDARFDAMEDRFDALDVRFVTKQDLSDAIQGLTHLMVTLMVGMMLTLTTIMLTAVALVR